jgi:hypothetical protein
MKDLDVDGMSSEASVGEVGTQRYYRIKKLPWRHPDLTSWLHRIDMMPLKNARQAIIPRRSECRQRRPSDLISDSRPPVHGLPMNLYSKDWLHGRSNRFIETLDPRRYMVDLPLIDQYVPRH